MSANRSFRAEAAAFCAKRGDNLSRATKRQALVRTGNVLNLNPNLFLKLRLKAIKIKKKIRIKTASRVAV